MSDTYTPLSLKYRPKTFAQLVGQDVPKKYFTHAIQSGQIANAFLLFGPSGCGKTSLARILAASLNCETSITVHPCGKCRNCLDIFASASPDVIELDAASNSGIDEIRDIKKDAQYMPVNSRYKVFIIDEVHALTPRAEEAMLKVLEEPPQSVKFVLATTDRHKIKDTILWRCQDFKLQLLPWNQIGAHLKEVCEQEKLQLDVDALKVIAKSAQGHPRNALQNLDKVVLYAGGEPITRDVAVEALCIVDETVYFTFVDAVVSRNFAVGMRTVQAMLEQGTDLASVLNGLADHLRTLLVIQLCDSTSGLIYLGEEDKKRYLQQAQKTSRDLVDDMITHLVNVHRGIFYNTSPQVLLEQYLLKSIKSNFRLASGS